MNELANTRLFGLLAEPSKEVTNEEMSNAYGEFLEKVDVYLPSSVIRQKKKDGLLSELPDDSPSTQV